jgi:hypothetical protein
MRVILDTANQPATTPANPPKLMIERVEFSTRFGVEKFIKHVRAEMDLLWPLDKK